jgi:hypothetical protein
MESNLGESTGGRELNQTFGDLEGESGQKIQQKNNGVCP